MWIRSFLAVAALVVCLGVAETAFADVATVRLVNGGVVTGQVEMHMPGERIVLRLSNGEVVTLVQAEIASVELVAGPPDESRPPPGEHVPQPRIPSWAPVITLSSIGVGLVIGGTVLYALSPTETVRGDTTSGGSAGSWAGVGLMCAGGALLIGALVAIPLRLRHRAQFRREYASLTFAPTLDVVGRQYGFTAALRF